MAVYDYGSGCTYTTPQAAFDALQAANEVEDAAVAFTEVNYLRAGADAVHENSAEGEPVLRLAHSTTDRGVLPTKAFPLVIDEAAGVTVILADTNGSNVIVGSAADGTAAASHVVIDGPQLISESASGILANHIEGIASRPGRRPHRLWWRGSRGQHRPRRLSALDGGFLGHQRRKRPVGRQHHRPHTGDRSIGVE